MLEESIKPLFAKGDSFNPNSIFEYRKARVKFKGICLR